MKLPEIAARLREKADEYLDPELAQLANAIRRRPPARRAPPTSRPMHEDLRLEIRMWAFNHPEASYVEIGRHFNVNPGRVSEAIRGFRK